MVNFCKCGCGKEIQPKSTWAKGHNANKNYDRFDWSSVIKDYEELGTLESVAEKYGCSLQAVYYQLNKIGVDTSQRFPEYPEILEGYKELKSVIKVAEKYGCSCGTVAEKLKELDDFNFNHDNKKLDLPVGVGRYGEQIALLLLENSMDMNEENIHAPYDIEWRGKKIDVKTSKIRFSERRSDYYSFSTKNKECTHYLLIALGEDLIPVKALLVPTTEVTLKNISFTTDNLSKWDDFSLSISDEKINSILKMKEGKGNE